MPDKKAIRVVVDVRCELGEGPIWHSERETLLWFDVYAQVLFETDAKGEPVRALGFGGRTYRRVLDCRGKCNRPLSYKSGDRRTLAIGVAGGRQFGDPHKRLPRRAGRCVLDRHDGR